MQYILDKLFLSNAKEYDVCTKLTFSPDLACANDKNDFFVKVVQTNNQEVDKLIKVFAAEITEIRRRLVFNFANLSAALAELISRFYQKDALVT